MQYETGPEASIVTAEDALWWSFVTITTVGYGDHHPVTTLDRCIAVVLMVAGVGAVRHVQRLPRAFPGSFQGYCALRRFQSCLASARSRRIS